MYDNFFHQKGYTVMTEMVNGKFHRVMILLAGAIGLYFCSLYNYLLFHSFAEFFSIAVSFAVFMIAWNSKGKLENNYVTFIGIAYLFIGVLDIIHTLAYKGMPIFTDYDYYATQLWIASRYMESITLLIAFAIPFHKRKMSYFGVLYVYSVITALIICSIFVWKIFPECFVSSNKTDKSVISQTTKIFKLAAASLSLKLFHVR